MQCNALQLSSPITSAICWIRMPTTLREATCVLLMQLTTIEIKSRSWKAGNHRRALLCGKGIFRMPVTKSQFYSEQVTLICSCSVYAEQEVQSSNITFHAEHSDWSSKRSSSDDMFLSQDLNSARKGWRYGSKPRHSLVEAERCMPCMGIALIQWQKPHLMCQ